MFLCKLDARALISKFMGRILDFNYLMVFIVLKNGMQIIIIDVNVTGLQFNTVFNVKYAWQFSLPIKINDTVSICQLL